MSVTLIGSRNAPNHILDIATELGIKLAQQGREMWSGGAIGMDSAFEQGYIKSGRSDLMNIILPINGFNGKYDNSSNYSSVLGYDERLLQIADDMINEIHPHYNKLNGFSYFAHIGNCFQVLGKNLDTPTLECFLYAPVDGNGVKGGTRKALRYT